MISLPGRWHAPCKLTVLPLILVLTSCLAWATIIIEPLFILETGTLTQENNTESFSPATMGNPASRQATAWIDAVGLGNFDYDFSTKGNIPFTVLWKAPADKLIEIRAPVGFDSVNVIFIFGGGTQTFSPGSVSDSDPTIEISGQIGKVPPRNGSINLAGPSGSPTPRFVADLTFNDLPGGRRFYLESVSVSTGIPSSYDRDWNLPLNEFRIIGFANRDGPGALAPTNAGQWVRLVDRATVENLVKNRAAKRRFLKRKIAALKRQIQRAKKAVNRSKASRLNRKRARFVKRLKSLPPFP